MIKKLSVYSISFIASLIATFAPLGLQAGELESLNLTVDGTERSYLLYSPDNLNSKAPAMLVLHGGLGNAKSTQAYGMNDVADREGFLVVYPEGSHVGRGGILTRNRLTWNAGECCGRAANENIDDVKFIGQLIETLIVDHQADANRIYVTGMSNGAMMTYRLLCELPDKIAAAMPVAGALTIDHCPLGSSIPILHIHGSADANVPVAGGTGDKAVAKMNYRPLTATLSLVSANRDCEVPSTLKQDDGREIITYQCHQGAPVSAIILPDVEHTWPGLSFRGKEGGDFSASEAVWKFARTYTK